MNEPTERESAFVSLGILSAALMPIHDMAESGVPTHGEMTEFWKLLNACVKDVEKVIEKHRKKINKAIGLIDI